MSWLRRAVRLLPLCALLVFITSCSDFWVSNSSIESVTISPAAVLLEAGATPADSYSTLTFSSLTAGGTTSTDASKATWASSSNSVVSVNAGVLTAGTSTAVNPTAAVTAKDGGVTSNTCNVLLYTGAAPTTLTVTAANGLSTQATSFQANASATFPGDSALSATGALNQYVTWSSSSATAATVSSTGYVTVLSTSTPFTITATATFGTASATAAVTGSTEFNNTTII